MNRLTELLDKLPTELREIAERYLPAFEDATAEDVKHWIMLVTENNWRDAYTFAICKMSTDDLVGEQTRLNAIVAGLNDKNARFIDAKKKMLRDVLQALVTMGIAAAKGD